MILQQQNKQLLIYIYILNMLEVMKTEKFIFDGSKYSKTPSWY